MCAVVGPSSCLCCCCCYCRCCCWQCCCCCCVCNRNHISDLNGRCAHRVGNTRRCSSSSHDTKNRASGRLTTQDWRLTGAECRVPTLPTLPIADRLSSESHYACTYYLPQRRHACQLEPNLIGTEPESTNGWQLIVKLGLLLNELIKSRVSVSSIGIKNFIS